MKHAPRLQPNLQVLCYLDTLTRSQRLRLPAVIPYWYSLERVKSIAQPSKRVIQFVPMAEGQAA